MNSYCSSAVHETCYVTEPNGSSLQLHLPQFPFQQPIHLGSTLKSSFGLHLIQNFTFQDFPTIISCTTLVAHVCNISNSSQQPVFIHNNRTT